MEILKHNINAPQGGQDGGTAVAEILCGKRYPSGKLSDTIVENIEDYPIYNNFNDIDANIYSEDVYVGYRYFETFAKNKVIYPFGFGLSYTEFETNVLSTSIYDKKICIEVDVKNVGDYYGKEVVQVYYEGVGERISRPARELVAFEKTKELAPGENQVITLTIKKADMAVYDDIGTTGNKSCYILEKGKFNIYVGTNVRNAVNIFTIEQEETEIVQRLSERLTPVNDFERIINLNGKVGYEIVKGKKKKTEYKKTLNVEYTGDRGIKFADVYKGRESIENFVSQLSDFDLACISQGEGMNSPKVRPGTGGAFGGVTRELQNFGIPVVCVTDGPSGLRFDNGDIATSLPNGTLLSCTWNSELVEELYTYEGNEARENRVDGLLGPGTNIHRFPLCGRNFEYLSEDPYLSGKMATSMCKGLQNGGITGTIKHFAANNKEQNRIAIDMIISERALREIYLKPFEMVVKSNAITMLMTAYNRINGTYCSANYDLNTGILREEWGYDGIVMTDWWTKTCYSDSSNNDTLRAYPIKAQNDVYMVNSDVEKTAHEIIESIQNGIVTRSELVRNAINILKVILKTPTFTRCLECDMLGTDSVKDISDVSLKGRFENVESGDEIVIIAQNSNQYVLKIKYISDKSELMQIPIKIYMDNISIGTCMARGTKGIQEELLSDLYIIEGNHAIQLYFESDSINEVSVEIYSN